MLPKRFFLVNIAILQARHRNLALVYESMLPHEKEAEEKSPIMPVDK